MTSENMLFTLLVMGLLGWLVYHRSLCEGYALETGQPCRPWHLRPRTPKDCPQCQCDHPHSHKPPDLIPCSQLKSQWGRRKELVSEGNACPNKACVYYGVTDQNIHALVDDGVEGVHEPIQWQEFMERAPGILRKKVCQVTTIRTPALLNWSA